jgi:hypothetical protein
MIPTAKFIADFHRPVIAPAGRTKKQEAESATTPLLVFPPSIFCHEIF